MRAVLLSVFCCLGVISAGGQEPARDYSRVTIGVNMDGRHCYFALRPGEQSPCPEYSASVDENGTVIYNGLRGAKVQGEKIHSIPVSVVQDLVAEFFHIKFFSLLDRYESKKHPDGTIETIDHAYASTISIDVDGKKKSVYIFYGAPDKVTALQRKLLEALQVAQYAGKQ